MCDHGDNRGVAGTREPSVPQVLKIVKVLPPIELERCSVLRV